MLISLQYIGRAEESGSRACVSYAAVSSGFQAGKDIAVPPTSNQADGFAHKMYRNSFPALSPWFNSHARDRIAVPRPLVPPLSLRSPPHPLAPVRIGHVNSAAPCMRSCTMSHPRWRAEEARAWYCRSCSSAAPSRAAASRS